MDDIQNSESNQTTVQIPRSQTQYSHSEQNATLTATNQGTTGEEKNLGEPHKTSSLPPITYSEFSLDYQQNIEHANMTSSQNQGITNSTPLPQESRTRRPSTIQNELNGLLASNFLGPDNNRPLTMTRRRMPTLDQARTAFANALNGAEQEIRASEQWERVSLPPRNRSRIEDRNTGDFLEYTGHPAGF